MFWFLSKWRLIQSASWNTLAAFCLIVIATQFVAISIDLNTVHSPHFILRKIHGVSAFIVLISLFIWRKHWGQKQCVWVFTLLFLPFFFLSWRTEVGLSNLKQWVPFFLIQVSNDSCRLPCSWTLFA